MIHHRFSLNWNIKSDAHNRALVFTEHQYGIFILFKVERIVKIQCVFELIDLFIVYSLYIEQKARRDIYSYRKPIE